MSDLVESIHERCPCGAQVRVTGSAETVQRVSAAWRDDHQHTESHGICGDRSPSVGVGGVQDHCILKAGHDGWHHSRDGDWTHAPRVSPGIDTYEGDLR